MVFAEIVLIEMISIMKNTQKSSIKRKHNKPHTIPKPQKTKRESKEKTTLLYVNQSVQ